MNETTLLLVAAVVIIAAAVAGWYLTRQRRSSRMRQEYGHGYERAVEKLGSSSKAESELVRREKRAKKLGVQRLSAVERDRFSQEWRRIQADFVERPERSVVQADRLVTELLTARGYPVDDELQRQADVKVSHPDLLHDYRAARDVADRAATDNTTTEDLRRAMVHYRSLFATLLEDEGERHPDDMDHETEVRDERSRTLRDRPGRQGRAPRTE
jgi:hypothetical protein